MPVPSARNRRRIEDDEEHENSHTTSTPAQGLNDRPHPTLPSFSNQNLDDLLRPQPLGRAQVPNIRNLADFRQQNDLITKSIELLLETADQTAEAHSQNPEYEPLRQADEDLRELIDLQVENAARQKALIEMRQEMEAGREIDNTTERYTESVRTQMDAYRKLTSRKKYAQNADYHNFRDAVWSAMQEGPMPPIRDLIEAEQGDEDDSDDDIVAGGVTQNFRCPITTNLLEDPVTNSSCKHSYSKTAIYEFVQHNNRCPASGCNALVSRQTLRADPALGKKVATFQRREEERQFARRQQNTILD